MPTTTGRCREPKPVLCSGNTGSGLGWLYTTYGSSPIKKKKKDGTSAVLQSYNLDLNCPTELTRAASTESRLGPRLMLAAGDK